MLNHLVFTFKKTNLLLKIAKCKPENPSAYSKMFDDANKVIGIKTFCTTSVQYKKYVDKLLVLLSTNKEFIHVLALHKADINDLKKIIDKLNSYGMAHIVRGNPLSVASIAFVDSLNFILEHWDGENFSIDGLNPSDSATRVGYNLTRYFEK